ncbi:ABC transporter ATP-binding protein [Sphingobium sp.]|uniref:ATP-binding cassette domain-containing protein n=1 Tax=Sphingobium sp. TaxID=1912891 RepID=UPI00257CA59B|nr:ABC transporter ATP-binding protein [Sphingobium sp.]
MRTLLSVVRLTVDPALNARRDLAFAAGIEIISTILSVAGPYSLKLLIDRMAAGDISFALLTGLVLIFVLTMATGAVSALRAVHVQRIIDAVHARLVEQVVSERLSNLATSRDDDSMRVAGLLERLPFSLQIVIDGLLWRVAPLIAQTCLCLLVIAWLTPPFYALLMAFIIILYGAATWVGARWHRKNADVANTAIGNSSRLLADVLRNARRVVHNGALGLELDRISQKMTARRMTNEALSWSLVRLSLLQFVAIGLGLLWLLVLSGQDVSAGRMTVGDFVLLQAFATRLLLPLAGFGFIMSQASVAMATIEDVLARIGGARRAVPPDLPDRAPAHIRVDKVSHAYDDLPVLRDICFSIPAGSFAALVGANGSGKSTLAQIMAGAIQPDSGKVSVSGRDMQTIPLEWRHRHILYVPQFVGLLNRSLGENALYPPSQHEESELVQLLEAWNFYEPGRTIDLSRPVGELGERLSGGQIQKLELARISGIDVPALILDESSSALDPAAEAKIVLELRARMAGRTTLVAISHRASVAAMADQVVFLERGRVAAVGLHADLLASSASYRDLWNRDAGPEQ